MGIVDIHSRLSPSMRRSLALSEEAIARCCETLGVETIDRADVALSRTLYAADRAYWNQDSPELARIENFFIPGPAGDVPVRQYRSDTERQDGRPVILFIHGGGWIVGSCDTHDRICRLLALESGWDVLSVDYRLAPENPFPASVEDCFAALDWLASNGVSKGFDPTRIALAGDSAGANMAMACLIHGRDTGLMGRLRAGLLFYGAFGLKDGASHRLWGGVEDGLTESDLKFFRSCLFDESAGNERDGRFDILRADLQGLPPLHILEVVMDPLADDSAALAKAAQSCGVSVEHHVADGVLHGYLHMTREMPEARKAVADAVTFLLNRA